MVRHLHCLPGGEALVLYSDQFNGDLGTSSLMWVDAEGHPVTAFGELGVLEIKGRVDDFALDPAQRIVLASHENTFGKPETERGVLTRFPLAQVEEPEMQQVELPFVTPRTVMLSEGKIYVAGIDSSGAAQIARFFGDAETLDPSFGQGGVAEVADQGTPVALVALSGGATLLAYGSPSVHLEVVRLDAAGAVDSAFGPIRFQGEQAREPSRNVLALLNNEEFLLLDQTANTKVVRRYSADGKGVIDGFGENGSVEVEGVEIRGLKVRSSGSFVVVGQHQEDAESNASKASVREYQANGVEEAASTTPFTIPATYFELEDIAAVGERLYILQNRKHLTRYDRRGRRDSTYGLIVVGDRTEQGDVEYEVHTLASRYGRERVHQRRGGRIPYSEQT